MQTTRTTQTAETAETEETEESQESQESAQAVRAAPEASATTRFLQSPPRRGSSARARVVDIPIRLPR
jgi:hypothetical protein